MSAPAGAQAISISTGQSPSLSPTWHTVVYRLDQRSATTWQQTVWIDGAKYQSSVDTLQSVPDATYVSSLIGKSSYQAINGGTPYAGSGDQYLPVDVREFRVFLYPMPDYSVAGITDYITSLYTDCLTRTCTR